MHNLVLILRATEQRGRNFDLGKLLEHADLGLQHGLRVDDGHAPHAEIVRDPRVELGAQALELRAARLGLERLVEAAQHGVAAQYNVLRKFAERQSRRVIVQLGQLALHHLRVANGR